MTYGRARLWLGITGVGSLVTIAAMALALSLPEKWLDSQPGLGAKGFFQLLVMTGLFMAWLTPFDYLGGFLLPKKFYKSADLLSCWFRKYMVAVTLQGFLFVVFGSLILAVGRDFGLAGALILELLSIVVF